MGGSHRQSGSAPWKGWSPHWDLGFGFWDLGFAPSSPRRESSIHSQLVTCHIRRGGRRQEHERSLEVVSLRHPAERHARAVLLLELIVLPAGDTAWRQRV